MTMVYNRWYTLINPIWDWLWKHGWEEPVGPLGPDVLHSAAIGKGEPRPIPWRIAVPQLVQATIALDLSRRLDGPQQEQAEKSARSAINQIIDDWCGTPPRKWPWPYPGPPPWAWEIASELSLVAHSLAEGSLKGQLHEVAAQVVQNVEMR